MNNPLLDIIGGKPKPKPQTPKPAPKENPIAKAGKQVAAGKPIELDPKPKPKPKPQEKLGPPVPMGVRFKNIASDFDKQWKADPDGLPQVMAAVDQLLSQRIGDREREAIKSYIVANQELGDRSKLNIDHARDAIEIIKSQGVEHLETARAAIRAYRANPQGDLMGKTPISSDLIQARVGNRQGVPATNQQDLVAEGVKDINFGNVLQQGALDAIFPDGLRGARNFVESQVRSFDEQGRLDKLANMSNPEVAFRGVEAMLPGAGSYGETIARATGGGRSFETLDPNVQAGSMALDIGSGIALPGVGIAKVFTKAPTLGAKLATISGVAARFSAYDAPSMARLVMDADGDVGQAAQQFSEATFGQIGRLGELADPAKSGAEKVQIGMGAAMGLMLGIAGGGAGYKVATKGLDKIFGGGVPSGAEKAAIKNMASKLEDVDTAEVIKTSDDLIRAGLDVDVADNVAKIVVAAEARAAGNQASAATDPKAAEAMAQGTQPRPQNLNRFTPEYLNTKEGMNDLGSVAGTDAKGLPPEALQQWLSRMSAESTTSASGLRRRRQVFDYAESAGDTLLMKTLAGRLENLDMDSLAKKLADGEIDQARFDELKAQNDAINATRADFKTRLEKAKAQPRAQTPTPEPTRPVQAPEAAPRQTAGVEGKGARIKGDAQEVVEAYERGVDAGGEYMIANPLKRTRLAKRGVLRAGDDGSIQIPEKGKWVSLGSNEEAQLRQQLGIPRTAEWESEVRTRVSAINKRVAEAATAERSAKQTKELDGLNTMLARAKSIVETGKSPEGETLTTKQLNEIKKAIPEIEESIKARGGTLPNESNSQKPSASPVRAGEPDVPSRVSDKPSSGAVKPPKLTKGTFEVANKNGSKESREGMLFAHPQDSSIKLAVDKRKDGKYHVTELSSGFRVGAHESRATAVDLATKIPPSRYKEKIASVSPQATAPKPADVPKVAEVPRYETLRKEAEGLRGAEKAAKLIEARKARIAEAASGGAMESASGLNPRDLQEFVEIAKAYVEGGVDWVKGLKRDLNLSDAEIEVVRAEIEPKPVKAKPKKKAVKVDEPDTTALNRATQDAERAARGQEPTPKMGAPKKELDAKGKLNYTEDVAMREISRVLDSGDAKAVPTKDTAPIVLQHARKLKNDANKLYREIETATPERAAEILGELNSINALQDRVSLYTQQAGGQFHGLGQAMQIALKPDFTMAELMGQARAANLGAPVPEPVAKKIKAISEKHEGAQAEMDAITKADKVPDELKVKPEAQRGTKKSVSTGVTRGQRMRVSALDQLRKLGIKTSDSGEAPKTGGFGSKRRGAVRVPQFTLDTHDKIVRQIRSLAKSYIVDEIPGSDSLSGIIKLLKKDLPDMTDEQLLYSLSAKYQANALEADIAARQAAMQMRQLKLAAERRMMSVVGRAMRNTGEFVGTTSRGVQASADLSFAMIQGAKLSMTKEWLQAWTPAMKAMTAGDPGASAELSLAKIRRRPAYARAIKAGLGITDSSGSFSAAEELWAGETIARWARGEGVASVGGKVNPLHIVGKHFLQRSEAGYVTFLNELRMSLFENIGRFDMDNPEKLADYAMQINIMTGRGHGKIADALSQPVAGTTFFAPRYAWSEFQNASGVPFWASKTSAGKKAAAKLYARQFVLLGSVLGSALMLGGDVETDSRSSEWLNIRMPNGMTIDIFGKMFQPVKLVMQMGYGGISRKGNYSKPGEFGLDPLWRYLSNKLSPAARLAIGSLSGWKSPDKEGKWVDTPPEKIVADMITPMSPRNIVEESIESGVNPLYLAMLTGLNFYQTPEKGESNAPPLSGPTQGLRQLFGQPKIEAVKKSKADKPKTPEVPKKTRAQIRRGE